MSSVQLSSSMDTNRCPWHLGTFTPALPLSEMQRFSHPHVPVLLILNITSPRKTSLISQLIRNPGSKSPTRSAPLFALVTNSSMSAFPADLEPHLRPGPLRLDHPHPLQHAPLCSLYLHWMTPSCFIVGRYDCPRNKFGDTVCSIYFIMFYQKRLCCPSQPIP